MDTIIALILGLIEGNYGIFCQFRLPAILILAEHLLHFEGERGTFSRSSFSLAQFWLLLALYWKRFRGLLFGQKALRAGAASWLLLLTTPPACVFGLLCTALRDQLFSPATVFAALITGAAFA